MNGHTGIKSIHGGLVKATSGGPAKKLTIKPLKCKRARSIDFLVRCTAGALTVACHAAKPKLPQDFESTTWAKLDRAIRAVQSKQGVSLSLEELYRVLPMTELDPVFVLPAALEQSADTHFSTAHEA